MCEGARFRDLRRYAEHQNQASLVSTISSADWPDQYPTLLNDLIGLLTSGNPVSVQGAMEVFVEFVQSDLTEEQLLPVLRDLLPILLGVLGASQVRTF